MARPKGSIDKIQKQYQLPEGVSLADGNPDRYTKETTFD